MKLSNVIGLVLALVVLGIAYNYFFPQEVEKIIYKEGIPDTVVISKLDTVIFTETVFKTKTKFKTDTVFVSEDGKHHATSLFSLQEDSTKITGRVNYDEPNFSFENVKAMYPEITRTISRIDTLTQTVDIPFYSDNWFWAFLGSVSILILLLFKG